MQVSVADAKNKLPELIKAVETYLRHLAGKDSDFRSGLVEADDG